MTVPLNERDSTDPRPGAGPEAMFRLDGRIAIVTGASSGLGARFATLLASAGATVVAAARRLDRLERLAEGSERIVPWRCDVAVPEDLEAMVTSTVDRFGRLDVVINNAGITDPEVPPLELDLDDVRRVLEVNLVAPFHLARLAARHMTAAGQGAIVNVASILGLVAGTPLYSMIYGASKGGLVNLTRDLAARLARSGVRVNALAPGWFASEMTAGLVEDERLSTHLRRNTPMNRLGALDELDGALLFLASDASTFYTGQTLVVDGGWTAR